MTRIKQGEKRNRDIKRKLRSEMTPAENKLWLHLRARQLEKLKFRRQHGIGPYIVDFYCPAIKLVIEVDGDVHAGEAQIAKDCKRDNYLKSLGLQVIRYRNDDVLNNVEGVMEDLFGRLPSNSSTLPHPPLQREGVK
ncbi:MAG: endonuclease domain-containing protein [Deltaproteobacteria bacterium]|nr:endonuclease domain-containing protein [Deltaproteobacteria bacterium]